MQPDEIETIVKVFVSLGVRKIRLTGGEPLARPEFRDILERIAAFPVAVKITTNGTLLHRQLGALKQAGVDTLNISLDTLSEKKYFAMTKSDRFSQTMANIRKALDAGFGIKINMVVMKGVNDQEISAFVDWAARDAIEVRFIEYMPFTGNRWTGNQVVSRQEILDSIGQRYRVTALANEPHATSTSYAILGTSANFAIISTMSAPCCAGCNRMRLTADGKMKNCLFSKEETDLLSALRAGLPIEPLIRENVSQKAPGLGGQFGGSSFAELRAEDLENRSMISIGG